MANPDPAGYSGTPLVRKLGYAPGMRAYLDGVPDHYRSLLAGLPDGVHFLSKPTKPLDFVHLFTTAANELGRKLTRYRKLLADDGMLWVSWPKKAAGVPTDLTEDAIREAALPLGFVDVKVCAVDTTWSGLKLVVRKELRAKAAGR
jgi:hypothetical protein